MRSTTSAATVPANGASAVVRVLGVEHQHAVVVGGHGAERRCETGPRHEWEVRRLGHQELALGVREVAGQLVAPMGRVGPDDHGAHRRGRFEPEDEFGNVVEQHGHVKGAVHPLRPEPGRPLRRPRHHLGMGQAQFARDKAEMVVVGPSQDGPGDRHGRRRVFARIAGFVRRRLS